jgi:hypothetical protein
VKLFAQTAGQHKFSASTFLRKKEEPEEDFTVYREIRLSLPLLGVHQELESE